MIKYKYFILAFFLLLYGCGIPIPSFEPLEDKLLKIVEISPASGEEIASDGKIVMKFSLPVNPLSIGPENIFVLKSEELPDDLSDLGDADITSVPGLYVVSEGGDEVEYQPEGSFRQSGEYSIVVTDKVSSIEGLPFINSSNPKEPFTSSFFVAKVEGGLSGGGSTGSGSGSGGSGDGFGDGGDVGGGDEPPPPGPAYLVINEIYYDADGTDSNGDLFIELLGEPGGCLEGYYINLVNGDDGKTYKTIPMGEGHYVPDDGLFVIADVDSSDNTNVENADFLVNFDPQNGPDSVQLVSRDNELLDAVGYGSVPTATAQNGFVTYETAPAEDPGGGMSLSRLADAPDTDDNSADFAINPTPSPGTLDILTDL